MPDQPREIVPKREVVARAHELYKVTISDDQLDRWRKADLIGDTVPLEGSTERGYQVIDANKIVVIAWTIATFRLRRPKKAELAFWLLYCGYPAPANLVLDHAEASIRYYQNRIRRILDSFGAGYLASSGYLVKVAGFLFKAILRLWKGTSQELQTFRQLLELTTLLLANGFLAADGFHKARDIVRQIITTIRGGASPSEQDVVVVWETLRDASHFLRLDGKNRMLQAVKSFDPNDSEELQKAVFLTRRLRELAAPYFPWIIEASDNTINILWWKMTRLDYDLINRALPPCALAINLAVRHEPDAQQRAREILSGNVENVVRDIEGTANFIRHIAAKPTSEPPQDSEGA